MQNPDKRSTIFPVSTVLIAFAAVSGYLVYKAPYRSARPEQQQIVETAGYGDENVHARLWQDPFQTVEAHKKIHPEARPDVDYEKTIHSLEHMQRQIRDRVEQDKEVLLLPVMIHGGPYAEDKENRLRCRYAMISALGNEGYSPESNRFIGYFVMHNWLSRLACHLDENKKTGTLQFSLIPDDPQHAHELTVPFEWFYKNELFTNKGQKYDSVLVLWIKDVEFNDLPLIRLALFKDRLTSSLIQGETKQYPPLEMKVLGPVGSTELIAMLQDEAELLVQHPNEKARGAIRTWLKEQLSGITLYSPWSTISEELLLELSGQTDPPEDGVLGVLKKKGIDFVSTICRDDQLAVSLLEELSRRGVDLSDEDRIVLVSEWDTFYGKALPNTIKKKIKDGGNDNDLDEQVVCINYLRGLDGKAPGLIEPGTSGSGKDNAAPSQGSIRYPTGESQLDTMRRLAYWLKRLEKCDGREIKAVGVIGSDVYDKLLMLQALRQILPGALYFTTDFDARLTHPDQYKWTRNLIIASGYGPRLGKKYQTSMIPPFRGCYQASIYMSCYAALNGEDETLFKKELKPRLFEVGRTAALDITLQNDPSTLHQETNCGRVSLGLIFMLLFVLIFILFIVSVILSPRVRELLHVSSFLDKDKHEYQRKLLHLFLWSILIFILFGLCVWLHNANGEGEPFAFLEGISIWPTDMIRLLSVLLSAFFFYIAYIEIRDNSIKNDKRFGFYAIHSDTERDSSVNAPPSGSQEKRPNPFVRLKRCIHRWLEESSVSEWNPENGGARDCSVTIDAREIWRDYLHRGRLRHRVWRIIPMCLAWAAFALMLMILLGFPTWLYRGTMSLAIDVVVLVSSIVTVVLLTFFVVDATRLCKKFIVQLSGGTTRWPIEPKNSTSIDDGCELNDIQLIASRTKVVGRLIIFPFITIFLMVVSRCSYFDNWDWPPSLIIVITGISLHAIGCAIVLRRVAEDSRKRAVRRLENNLLISLKEEGENSPRSKQIEKLIQMIQSIREGA